MSRNKRSDKKAWSKQFAEEYDDLEYVSRSERTRGEKKKNSEGMSPMLTGTVIFLAMLILAIIFYYIWFTSDQQKILDEPEIEATMREKNEEKEKKEEQEKKEQEKKEQEKKEQEKKEQEKKEQEKKEQEQKEQERKEQEQKEKEQKEQQERDEKAKKEQEERERQEQEDRERREQEEQQNQETNDESGSESTYTVSAGDNMYRIALNHGMTTEELMELNGLSDESVYVGQVLKVK